MDEVRWRHGVDAAVSATLGWERRSELHLRCSFIDDEAQTLTIRGTLGTLELASEAHTGGVRAEVILHDHADGTDVIRVVPTDPYQTMIETYARAVRGAREWPRPVERSLEMIRLLDRIKAEWHR